MQLRSSRAAPQNTRCTPSDISQQRTHGHVASVSLVIQSSNDYQVSQGLKRIKFEDPTGIHSQKGFLPPEKMCHQKDSTPTDYHEPHKQVKSDQVQSDECTRNSGEWRKWLEGEARSLKEVVKVGHTDWSVETSNNSSENNDQKEHYNKRVSEVGLTHVDEEPHISSLCTEQVHEKMHTDVKPYTCMCGVIPAF
ncbi:hypothetical protein LSAT2_001193 [Lamellibrachia satsuma]|nr:hypothetical protein LSAT2_001193 [Lamellibrachia satsuma]